MEQVYGISEYATNNNRKRMPNMIQAHECYTQKTH